MTKGIIFIFFNFQGSLPSSPRLSFNTKGIELSVSNRANQVIDVQKIYEDGKNGIQIHIPRTNKTREGLPGNILIFSLKIQMRLYLDISNMNI